ncbi:MAG: CatB-related O-acetyltransferase [Mariniphaga sp.]
MIVHLKNKINMFFFKRNWKKSNGHNQTVPITIFPPELVSVGSYSYGCLDVTTYDLNNITDRLIIGNFVSIAPSVKFQLCENHQTRTFTTFPLKTILTKQTSSEDAISKGSIYIKDEVWIGHGVTVHSGVTIGKGAIIASGAVVTSDIPPYTIAGGIPAKVIKYRFSDDVSNRLLKLSLIDLPINVIEKNLDVLYRIISNVEDLDTIELLFKIENEKRNN